ncbi:hypothetical protein CcaverHIS002_0700060 [Cutaneotrichosporon cavernicola]|uniref:Ricin B lectin domain-containing protein n=1 Tax=Cutaneotrichosporon cavernicola TaxID=279322 RepID=A0AA48L9J8_9TREE|nr:uncharacterized protein CcaverHIS019_0700060 [Cutaneotrichosporon cavernicola]BEI86660.1 hypothetical protein CcaverHIS002_0700060 [Cutaneotrichosporon cavernicola]BEI94434.1 hypothetical protein CcaverHIS019_0700060 [Cutaneotrichosporon cavernicola]BEJ02211.1 hypothetical protein CcaverHIS631_0700060 [Cutaneotrichosporon cavernicola]BEJ09971.1 hypothetical protein CcaverHIS641_0700060 [Cutaneotrichosporon cavernicola]
MLLSFSLAILAVLGAAAPVELDARASAPPYRYIHPANAPDQCITAVPGTKGYEGTQLVVRPCVASADQRFRVNWPTTTVKFLAHPELCIDSSGTPGKPDKKPKLKAGRPALLLPCPAGPNVGENMTTPVNGYWDRSDYTHLRLWGTDVCLDGSGGAVHQSRCDGGVGQEWLFDVVGE